MMENNKKFKFKIPRKNVLFISSIDNQVSQVLKKFYTTMAITLIFW